MAESISPPSRRLPTVGATTGGAAHVGSAEEATDLVGGNAEIGFTCLMVSTDWNTPNDLRDELAWFAENVAARC